MVRKQKKSGGWTGHAILHLQILARRYSKSSFWQPYFSRYVFQNSIQQSGRPSFWLLAACGGEWAVSSLYLGRKRKIQRIENTDLEWLVLAHAWTTGTNIDYARARARTYSGQVNPGQTHEQMDHGHSLNLHLETKHTKVNDEHSHQESEHKKCNNVLASCASLYDRQLSSHLYNLIVHNEHLVMYVHKVGFCSWQVVALCRQKI